MHSTSCSSSPPAGEAGRLTAQLRDLDRRLLSATTTAPPALLLHRASLLSQISQLQLNTAEHENAERVALAALFECQARDADCEAATRTSSALLAAASAHAHTHRYDATHAAHPSTWVWRHDVPVPGEPLWRAPSGTGQADPSLLRAGCEWTRFYYSAPVPWRVPRGGEGWGRAHQPSRLDSGGDSALPVRVASSPSGPYAKGVARARTRRVSCDATWLLPPHTGVNVNAAAAADAAAYFTSRAVVPATARRTLEFNATGPHTVLPPALAAQLTAAERRRPLHPNYITPTSPGHYEPFRTRVALPLNAAIAGTFSSPPGVRPASEGERRAAARLCTPARVRYDPRSDGKPKWVKLTDGAVAAARPGGNGAPFSRPLSDSAWLVAEERRVREGLEERHRHDTAVAASGGDDTDGGREMLVLLTLHVHDIEQLVANQ